MKISYYDELSEKSLIQSESLRRTVKELFERKRRLGHYVVIWKNGKPVMIGDDAPKVDSNQNKA